MCRTIEVSALLAAIALLAGGCNRSSRQAEPAVELDILCGTSFGPPMQKLVELYAQQTGNRAVLVFGGSEDHLPKVKLNAAGDVYVSHTPYMQYTRDAGALLREVEVGHLAPVLVVRKGNPKGLKSVEDLGREGVRVVLPNPEFSTCGEMVFKMLDRKGIKEGVLKNVGNDLVKHHSTVGNHLKLEARDAGIMWNGVAHNFLDVIEIVPGPYEYDDEIRVAVMGLSYSKKKHAVEQFLDFVEKHGRRVFTEFGYVKNAAPKQEKTVTPMQDKAASRGGRLLLLCGAGIRPAAAEIAEEFSRLHDVAVECDYAGSEVLLSRIKLRRQGDLYMPGDVHYVDQAEREGLIAARGRACYFIPVILVRKGNPKNIGSLADLTRPGIKVGLGDPKACAIGRKCAMIFAKNTVAEADIDQNVKFRSLTVNELGNLIKLGRLDAVIVWDAVAAYFADDADVIPIPPKQNVVSEVVVGVLKSSAHPELAGKFVEFVGSPTAQAIFQKHHYTTTPPE